MSYDLRDVLDSARSAAPPPRTSVEDVVTAGRALRRRRRYTWLTGGTAAVAVLAVATAAALPHLTGANDRPDTGLPAASDVADAKPLTFPALSAPFMYSVKGYSVGSTHVGNPVFATASYQESKITQDGVAKSVVTNSTETWRREYDRPVGVLTVYRPGVFNPAKYSSGTKVTVRGLPGLLTQFEVVVYDQGARKGAGADAKAAMSSGRPVKVPALAWQYADGAWATITTTTDFRTADPSKDLVALAGGLTPTTPTLVRVPYQMRTPLTGYHLVAVGSFEPSGLGDEVSVAYFARTPLPTTGLVGRYTDEQLTESGGAWKVLVAETAPAAPTDPNPHPNPNQPCQPGFCDRAINDGYFAEIMGGNAPADLIRAVTDGLVFDDPANPTTWHDVTTFGGAR